MTSPIKIELMLVDALGVWVSIKCSENAEIEYWTNHNPQHIRSKIRDFETVNCYNPIESLEPVMIYAQIVDRPETLIEFGPIKLAYHYTGMEALLISGTSAIIKVCFEGDIQNRWLRFSYGEGKEKLSKFNEPIYLTDLTPFTMHTLKAKVLDEQDMPFKLEIQSSLVTWALKIDSETTSNSAHLVLIQLSGTLGYGWVKDPFCMPKSPYQFDIYDNTNKKVVEFEGCYCFQSDGEDTIDLVDLTPDTDYTITVTLLNCVDTRNNHDMKVEHHFHTKP